MTSFLLQTSGIVFFLFARVPYIRQLFPEIKQNVAERRVLSRTAGAGEIRAFEGGPGVEGGSIPRPTLYPTFLSPFAIVVDSVGVLGDIVCLALEPGELDSPLSGAPASLWQGRKGLFL
jgi:hypothetical protein